MTNRHDRFASLATLLMLCVAGCATQGTTGTEGVSGVVPAANTPTAAAAPAAKPAPAMPPPTALETEAGIQIAHIGLAASGGLVDARFKVLDAAKVKVLLADPANAPQLIAGDKPPLMAPHHALKGARLATGTVFFILYPNTRNAVQPGTEVMVAIGQTRLGPITAQ